MKNKRGRRTFAAKTAGKIYNKRKKSREAEGVFYSNSRGGIFFENSGSENLSDKRCFVDLDFTRGAMNGDTVLCRIDRDGSATVVRVLERAVTKLVGTLVFDERYDPEFYFEPEDSKIRFEFAVTGAVDGLVFNDGDKVELQITYYPEYSDDCPEGIISCVFGDGNSVEANYQAVLHAHEIPIDFAPKALEEAEMVSREELSADRRLDLREKFIMTIDGEDAKDLDDAISVEKRDAGYILGIHIADVSHYVRAGSAIDTDAYERGTSVYFTDKVVPMLPKILSNGICSLNAGCDRYALSAFVYLDKFGEIQKCELSKSIICSKIRGVYSEVNEIIDGTSNSEILNKYSDLCGEPLENIRELYRILAKKSEMRGALELESAESLIVLDENGAPTDIIPRERGESERIIEQFMLCANEAVASWLTERDYPCGYRIHEAPNKEKVSDFIKFAQAIGLNPEYIKLDRINAKYFGRLLDKARGKGLGESVSYMLLRTLSKAKYSNKNSEHFGLASKNYCHFTSPIRRYPDLTIHRIITRALENGDAGALKAEFSDFVATASKKCSETEVRAMETERDIEDLYKCVFMKRFVGKVLNARVSSVTSFGLFCMTEKACEGLVPITSMSNRYRFDKETLTLSSYENTYKLGDTVKVKVVSSDISTRKIEFSLVDERFDFNCGFGKFN